MTSGGCSEALASASKSVSGAYSKSACVQKGPAAVHTRSGPWAADPSSPEI